MSSNRERRRRAATEEAGKHPVGREGEVTPGALGHLGYESTATQRRVVLAVALTGVVLASICAGSAGVEWSSWQWGVVLFVAFDLVGGVAAMCLPPAIRKIRPPDEPLRPVLFAVFHVHPLLLAFALPGADWVALSAVYLSGLVGALLMTVMRAEFRASAALAWCTITLAIVALAGTPSGFEWLAPAFVLKLVGSRAVHPEVGD